MAFELRSRLRAARPPVALATALGAALPLALVAGAPAQAFDFLNPFGLFGPKEEVASPRGDAIAYGLSFDGVDDKSLRLALQDASTLYRLRQEPPPDGDGLVRRAEADLPRLTDALWGAGYYDGQITIAIDGVVLASGGPGAARAQPAAGAAALRAEAYRNRAPVPVQVRVEPGPLYTLRSVAVRDARTRAPFAPEDLPPRLLRVRDGDPASAAAVLALQARLVDHFRGRGHPFAKVAASEPVVDHHANALDVSFSIDPGPRAGIGEVAVRGTEAVDPAVVWSFIYAEPGDPYSPKAVADVRTSVSRIEALGSVRVREAETLDARGNLPLFVEVTERPARLFGVSARYSTVDGPGVRAYWAHRNLFGGAERLRFDADLYFMNRFDGRVDPVTGKREELGWDDLGGRFAMSFLKPALGGTRNDFLLDAFVAREVTEGYTSRAAGATAVIRYRFSDSLAGQGGIEVEAGQASDALGRLDYTLVGLPVSLTYDSTDSLLDPTRGVRVTASATPYPTLLGSDPGLFVAKGQGSAYHAFDEEARYVLAGRIGFGSITGADLADIPANRRFFAGGGGSVRGYAYKSLGPQDIFGNPLGGRSLLEGSVEARIKLTDTIGIVPFLDAGTAFEASLPDFKEEIRVAAGLGLRYYTGIGPIRLDVAVPLNRERGDSAAAVYISLGQAF
jgi:translocation and assembly module TamA